MNWRAVSLTNGGYPVPADPDIPAWIKPALWSPEVYPGVTILVEAPADFHVRTIPERFLHGASPMEQQSGILVVVISPDDGAHHLQIQGWAASARPAALIPLDGAEEIRIAELRRFLKRLTGASVPGLPRSLSLRPYHVWRMADVICAYAGRVAGASQREIGRVLDPSVRAMNARQWDTSSQRARVGRLLKRAARLADRREYVTLLRPGRFRLRA
ncbi:hypothetical protein GLUCOINTEAF2_0203493 [Komagataeibacter intermedius AF2]|uniref:T6SS Transcription factor RovC-like DNA binding domain-containing protein n=3 Tax=Komagataeibacter intermedius TaxID=66229 RepID=A0A0N0MDG3_9PROT|nr:hypothetical protein GLUCOINTEAF2_0203493 [Komagataeibacter intermedius AF2]GBQ72808.1 hypothetical protein AA0521_2200 [Komagataeibacter intermedius NRIC 0521]